MPAKPFAFCLARLGLALIAGSLALCANATAPNPGTVAAQVNGTAITRAELDQLVASAPAPAAADGNPAALQLAGINQLITRQLLTQSALRAGLDQQTTTRLQLARARRQALGQAYLQRQLNQVAQPTAQQVDQFIASHPKLFGERLTYHFTRATLGATDDWPLHRLQRELPAGKDLPALQSFFQRIKLPLRTESLWLGAEQIAPQQLTLLEGMGNGQLQWLPVEDGTGQPLLLVRHAAYPDPKDPARIRGAIGRGLWLEAVDTARRHHLTRLRLQASLVMAPPAQADASQPAAQVNGETITLAELNLALNPQAEAGAAHPASTPSQRQRVLDTLVDEALLAQQAVALGLHQQPELASQLKLIETSLVANRYLSQALAKLPTPPMRQVNFVISQQADLFASRKVYRFSEFIIRQPASTHLAQAQSALAALTSQQELQDALDKLGWSYGVNHLWRGPEQLNPLYRQTLANLATGEHRVFAAPDGQSLLVLHKADVYPDPIGADEAERIARGLVQNATQTEATQALLTRLRSEARVALAPDLLAAQQQLVAPAFRLDSLSPPQRTSWALATLQVMLLVLLLAAMLWFYRTSRDRVEFAIWRDRPTRWLDRWREASYTTPYFLGLSLAAGAATLALALPIWVNIRQNTLPKESLVIALGLGVGLVMAALALYRLHARQAQARAADANRWLPLGTVTLAQVLLTLGVTYAL